MRCLAQHYKSTRIRYPNDRLLIVFDIDGTIIDLRQMVGELLFAYDRQYGTRHFRGLDPTSITVHENRVEEFLLSLDLASLERGRILEWYNRRRWEVDSGRGSCRAYPGAMNVIRWFQLQPSTEIALNTGRPEELREHTLRSLDIFGRPHRVAFDADLLHMNPHGWNVRVAETKAEALGRFRKKGYRIFAVVDNEPSNLEAMIETDDGGDILFLHADTARLNQPADISRTISGQTYDLTGLMSEADLPKRVQLAWHGVNDEPNLRQFLSSSVRWGEIDVRYDPLDRIVLRHDPFEETSGIDHDGLLTLERFVMAADRVDKSIKLDLKEGGRLIEEVLELLALNEMEDQRLWFNGNIEVLSEAGCRAIRRSRPDAVIQCPIDFLAPLIPVAPERAQEILSMLEDWGMNRFSLGWNTPGSREIFLRLADWSHEINIYGVTNLESFLEASLLLPTSLTADFNFPSWSYFGRGSGQNGAYHRYSLEVDGVSSHLIDAA